MLSFFRMYFPFMQTHILSKQEFKILVYLKRLVQYRALQIVFNDFETSYVTPLERVVQLEVFFSSDYL